MVSSAILLAGPTGSGKSALALEMAEACDGEIINADSMQVYSDLRVLTARPELQDEARAPHHLYGVLDCDQRCSVGRWIDLAADALDQVRAAGKLPIFVGGTGLYLRALTDGLAPVPEIPPEVKEASDTLAERLTSDEFHRQLAARDPEMAARLAPSDQQRIKRAWQVIEATGMSLAVWQAKDPSAPLIPETDTLRLVIDLPRQILHDRCNVRFDKMIKEGALEEVRALMARSLDPALPAMKALGVPELASYLAGDQTFEAAVEAAKAATRRYVKRQSTWFRHQMLGWQMVFAQDSKSISNKIISIIRKTGLTA
ncbi:MAG TPA: tRNA (adenosine(37)-N6)-dimethylallyltransferase MiaA [Sneathiellales bacterium]|jgi:tRNA dimethylallyltransferase|nr:tRNA (adenosine(37)-N6)-dimethylallyltransferase MiaA [Sneathiellales bacterium]